MTAIIASTDLTTYVADAIALVTPGVAVAVSIIGSLWAARKLLSLVKRQTV